MNIKKWKFWKKARDYCNSKMNAAWMDGGNCDSACPNCKQWESHGNRVVTTGNPDDSQTRECKNCGHEWKTIFTPLGFTPVDE